MAFGPRQWLLVVAAACALGTVVVLTAGTDPKAPATRGEQTLKLTAAVEGQLLRVHWDRNDKLITNADRVEVRSTDGGLTEFKNLFGTELRAGGFDYYLRTGDVVLEIRAEHQGRTSGRAYVRYFAASTPDPAAASGGAGAP